MPVDNNNFGFDKWKFDSEVTACFDNMLSRSIPQYDIMRDLVFEIMKNYLNKKEEASVLDIGCSRGEAISNIVSYTNDDCKFFGIEISESMVEAAKKRFDSQANVSIIHHDLRNGLPVEIPLSDIILSVLTIQFTPIEYRQFIVQSIFNRLKEGGIFIFIEKILGSNFSIDKLMVDIYLSMKRNNGYTEEQIQRKKMSLEGVLVPVTSKWNEELLKMAGFQKVECIWRWMNFAGWIAIK